MHLNRKTRVTALLIVSVWLVGLLPLPALADEPITTRYVPALTEEERGAGADSVEEAIGLGAKTVILRREDAVAAIPAGVTLTLSSGTLTADAVLVLGGLNGNGTVAGDLFLGFGAFLAEPVTVRGKTRYEIYIDPAIGTVTAVQSGMRQVRIESSATGAGYYWSELKNPDAVYVGENRFLYNGGAYVRAYTVSYLAADGQTLLTQGDCTEPEAQTGYVLNRLSDKGFLGWKLAYGEAVLDPDGTKLLSIASDIGLIALTEDGGGSGGKGGRGGGSASVSDKTTSDTLSGSTAGVRKDGDEAMPISQTGASDRGARIRSATSSTRHTVTGRGSADVETVAAGRMRVRRFPWHWVGIAVGGTAVLAALAVGLRRRREARYLETLRKLNIEK